MCTNACQKGTALDNGKVRRVLIVSHDQVDRNMGGPGVRYWEMARVLSCHGQVTLAAPEGGTLSSPHFQVVRYRPSRKGAGPGDEGLVRSLTGNNDVVILNGRLLSDHPWLRSSSCCLVVDLYGPSLLENFELFLSQPVERQWEALRDGQRVLSDQLLAGDFFLCSTQRQRDFWLGMLTLCGRVNPETYPSDRTLSRMIQVAPFGLPDRPPRSDRKVLKGAWPGINEKDRVVLWGGGIWQWLDPLTLVRAIGRICCVRDDVKLFFLGTGHPDSRAMPASPMVEQAFRLAKQLGLLEKYVFFNPWVPYEQREAYLLESDVGVCLHASTLESRFSYRTRVLDYLWAGLPLVLTEGDAWADLTVEHGLGYVVPPGDDQATANALLNVLRPGEEAEARRRRIISLRRELTWEKTLAPLVSFCQQPRKAADSQRQPEPSEPERCAICTKLDEYTLRIRHLEEENARWQKGRVMRLLLSAQKLRDKARAGWWR